MAKTLLQTASTAKYNFALYGVDQPFSPAPGLVFQVASYEISYRAQDNVLPGLVPSQLQLQVFGGLSVGDYRTIFQDARSRYVIEMREGISLVWRGFLVPDLGQIEVINGQRFITLVFSDGFQVLERKADFFTTNVVRNHTSIIGEIFSVCKLSDAFEDGFYIGEHYEPLNSISGYTNQGGMYVTGSLRDGLIFNDIEPRSCREVIEDLCLTFNLQLMQDRGSLVFRSMHIKSPAWYNLYNYLGNFLVRITTPGPTQSAVVYAEGTEMYKPAIAELAIRHPYYGSPFIWYAPGNQFEYDNRQIGNVVSDGTTEVDFNGTVRVRYTMPANYGPSMVTFDVHLTFQYDGFYWDGLAWTQTPTYVLFKINTVVENPNAFELLGEEFLTINNYRLDDIPALGFEPFYFTVEAFQVAGPDLGDLLTTTTAIFEYKAGAPQYVLYIADNSARINGTTLDLETALGDIRQDNQNVLPGAIRYFTSLPPTGNGLTNTIWSSGGEELLALVSRQIVRKAFQPQQYYEIELDGNVTYNHTFTWESVDYKPVNLSMTDRSTRVTYRAFIDGELIPDGK